MNAKRRVLLAASAVALVLIGLVVWIPRRHVQVYKVTVLPRLGIWRKHAALNDRGQIAAVRYLRFPDRRHMFVRDRDGSMEDLGPMDVETFDFNSAGQIAGTLTDPNGNKQAFFWDPNDGLTMLDTLGGTESFAEALNNRGQVVGYSQRDKNRPQAFVWDKTGGVQSLTPGERQYGRARAINDAGQVLGEMGIEVGEFPLYPILRRYYWDSTDPSAIPPASPNDFNGGSDINNGGYVLTATDYRPNRKRWVCLWHKDTGMRRLFANGHLYPEVLNDANQVLYSRNKRNPFMRFSRKYFRSYKVHCLWDPKRGNVVLNDQVPRKLGSLTDVIDINNRGCILAT
ncbi:MAG: hypothetical protein ACYSW8_14945, partial [Planctomycetota bacterium]